MEGSGDPEEQAADIPPISCLHSGMHAPDPWLLPKPILSSAWGGGGLLGLKGPGLCGKGISKLM